MEERLNRLDFIIGYMMKERGESSPVPADLKGKQQLMRALMNIRPPRQASDEFLKAQDAELQLQQADRGVVTPSGTGLLLWQGDITRLRVDAIVNAANAQLLGCWAPLHACIDNCIHSAAGVQLRQECYELMQRQGHDEPTGQAKLTGGYNLSARHVIHTVGPIIGNLRGGRPVVTPADEQLLASCYRSCLDVAAAHQLQSIAFCCISTGVFHFPNQRAAEIAVQTVKDWLITQHPSPITQIVFNVFLDKDYDIYQRLLQQD